MLLCATLANSTASASLLASATRSNYDNVGKTGSDGDLSAPIPQRPISNVSSVDCYNMERFRQAVMHVPTGLFVAGSYAQLHRQEPQGYLRKRCWCSSDEDTYWQITAGIERNWFGIGMTTLYGEYARHEVGAGLTNGSNSNLTPAANNTQGGSTCGVFVNWQQYQSSNPDAR